MLLLHPLVLLLWQSVDVFYDEGLLFGILQENYMRLQGRCWQLLRLLYPSPLLQFLVASYGIEWLVETPQGGDRQYLSYRKMLPHLLCPLFLLRFAGFFLGFQSPYGILRGMCRQFLCCRMHVPHLLYLFSLLRYADSSQGILLLHDILQAEGMQFLCCRKHVPHDPLDLFLLWRFEGFFHDNGLLCDTFQLIHIHFRD